MFEDFNSNLTKAKVKIFLLIFLKISLKYSPKTKLNTMKEEENVLLVGTIQRIGKERMLSIPGLYPGSRKVAVFKILEGPENSDFDGYLTLTGKVVTISLNSGIIKKQPLQLSTSPKEVFKSNTRYYLKCSDEVSYYKDFDEIKFA